MPLCTMASRASTDWKTELVRTVVFPSRSSSVRVSIETWPGAPSNSKVCTNPSGEGSPWKTPWNPNALPASSEWTYRYEPPSRASNRSIVIVYCRGPSHCTRRSGSMNARNTSSRGASKVRSVKTCGTPGSAVTFNSVMSYPFLSDRLAAIDRSRAPAGPRAARRAARSSLPRIPDSPASHTVASLSGSASRWLSRAVARRVREISPARSSTLRCREIAGWVTLNGAASSATVASPSESRVRIARRVGSASAPNTASS